MFHMVTSKIELVPGHLEVWAATLANAFCTYHMKSLSDPASLLNATCAASMYTTKGSSQH